MNKKILVVDDEPACVLFLGTFLEESGYDVETCKDGTSAIERGKQFRPDFVITDWMLKDSFDGMDVAASIAEINPEVKTLFITGMATEALESKLHGIKNYQIVEKPLDLDTVLSIIQKWH